MKTLIIYTHPNKKGHNGFVLEEVKKHLKDYEVLDLYRMNYNPLFSEKELARYSHQKLNKIQKKMQKAEQLVFIYPVWWFTAPAILHGFFDRNLSPGFAFKYVKGVPMGLLKKKAKVFMTLGGPWFYYWLSSNLPKKFIKRTLNFCGMKPEIYQFFNCTRLTDKNKEMIRKSVRKAFK